MSKSPNELNLAPNYTFSKEETPKRFNNIIFDDNDLEALRTGNTTKMHQYVLDNKSGDETQYLPKGKFQLFKDDEGEVTIKIIPFCEKLEIPKKLLGKELSQEEVKRLEDGDFVQIKDQRTNENFYVQVDKEVNMVVIKSEKTLGIPNQMLGYTLSDGEKEKLANNELLPERIYKDSKGNYMMAQVTFSEDRKSVIFKNVTELTEKKAKELIPKVNSQVNVLKNAAFAATEIINADPLLKNEVATKKTETSLEIIKQENQGQVKTKILPFPSNREATLSVYEVGDKLTATQYKEKLDATLEAGIITPDWYAIHNHSLHKHVNQMEKDNFSNIYKDVLNIDTVVRDREIHLINTKNFSESDLGKVPELMKKNGYDVSEISQFMILADETTKKIIYDQIKEFPEKSSLQGKEKEMEIKGEKSTSYSQSETVTSKSQVNLKSQNQSINL